MASTATMDSGSNGRGHANDVFVRRGTLNLATYATNGIAVSKTTFDFAVELLDLRVDCSAGYVAEWDKTNAKVKVFWVDTTVDGAALAEIANETDLAAVNFRFRAEGR